jgi:hypothetical protein
MANLFQHLSTLRGNIFGNGQNRNAINYGGGASMPRETALDIADTSPTARLDKDPLGFSSLSYPKDLINDATNGHYMLFYINMQDRTRFPYTRAKDGVQIGKKIIKPVYENVNQDVDEGLRRAANLPSRVLTQDESIEGGAVIQHTNMRDIDNAIKKQQTIDNSDVKTLRKNKTKIKTGLADQEFMKNNTVRITDSIAIYLPPNVQDNYTTTYNATETGLLGFLAASGGAALTALKGNDYRGFLEVALNTAGGALEEVLKNVGLGVLETITQAEGGYELGNKIFGRSANPYMEVLFGGPELRTFTYNFTFAPRNFEEQEEVRKIIKLFRFHQAPELRNPTLPSMFMGLPSEFDIHYMYQPFNGSSAYENPFYNKIATCVLQSVNVDYTPGAVNSHQDGSPVQIKMSLNFLETEMITKDHVIEGY